MVAGRRAAVEVGCEEVEEERARVGGDAVVLCLWLNVEPVRLRGDHSMRCAASVFLVILSRKSLTTIECDRMRMMSTLPTTHVCPKSGDSCRSIPCKCMRQVA